MKTVIIDKNKKVRFNKVLEGILYIIGYTISFFLVSKIFKSFHLSEDLPLLYAFIAVIIIYILNKTVKPLIMFFTIPITGLTLGTFYFVVNTLILKLVDFIMGKRLDFTNIWILFFISILISLINLLIELIIIKPIIKKVKTSE